MPCLTTKPHYDDLLRSQLRLQNDGLNGVFSLCDDQFPASGTDSSQNDDFPPADWQFQNGHRVNKMAPCCFLRWIPRKTATENGCPMEDLHWTVNFKPFCGLNRRSLCCRVRRSGSHKIESTQRNEHPSLVPAPANLAVQKHANASRSIGTTSVGR